MLTSQKRILLFKYDSPNYIQIEIMNYGIIAAGEGSRLASEGVNYPKPLVPVNGEPMIGRLIEIFRRNGARRVCIIVNEFMTEVREYVEGLRDNETDLEIDLTVKTTPSSMHSFYEIGKRLRGHGKFIATTVDTIFREEDFHRYSSAYEAADNISGMMAMTRYIDDEKPLYIRTGRDDRIEAFLDSYEEGVKYVSGGIYGLSDAALDVLDDCMERGVSRMRNYQRALIEAGLDIRGFDMGKILDVDHAEDIVKAEMFLKSE